VPGSLGEPDERLGEMVMPGGRVALPATPATRKVDNPEASARNS
jgi:hypothetical protein